MYTNKHDMNKEELIDRVNCYLDRCLSPEDQRYIHGDEVCGSVDAKVEEIRTILLKLINEHYEE